MKRLIAIPLALFALVLMTGLSFASNLNQKGTMGTMSTQKVTTFTKSQLHGLAVVNQDGKVIGEIKNLNMDPNTGALRSVTFKPADQSHYGLAPAWENAGNTNQRAIVSPNHWPTTTNIKIGGGV